MLRDAQGRAPAPHAAGLRGLDHRGAPRRGPTRADTPFITWDEKNGLVKVNPLAAWTFDELLAYADDHGVIVNPLVNDGYPSIGCATCTRKVAPGEDPRAGRWAGLDKTECGLHT